MLKILCPLKIRTRGRGEGSGLTCNPKARSSAPFSSQKNESRIKYFEFDFSGSYENLTLWRENLIIKIQIKSNNLRLDKLIRIPTTKKAT